MSTSSNSISWQSWSRKWGDWTTWIRNVTTTRAPVHRHLRVAPVNLQRQIEKALSVDKVSTAPQSHP